MAKHVVKASEPPKCAACGNTLKGAHVSLTYSDGSPMVSFCSVQCVDAWIAKAAPAIPMNEQPPAGYPK